MPSYCKWLILNQAVNDVLGKESGGLRGIKAAKTSVYQQLCTKYSDNFMTMSESQEVSLTNHKNKYIETYKRYAIIAYALKKLSDDVIDIDDVFKAVLYFRMNTREREDPQKNKVHVEGNLLHDLIRVYILDALSQSMLQLQQ